jgi:hypothetical protein
MAAVNREQTLIRTGAVPLALLVLLAVVAFASRYPVGARVGGVSQHSVGTIASVLIGLAGCAVLVVGTLVAGALRSPLRRGRPEDQIEETLPHRSPWVWPLLIAAISLCLGVAFAISAIHHAHNSEPPALSTGLTRQPSAPLPTVSPHASGLSPAAIAAAAGLVAVILLGWAVIAVADRRRSKGGLPMARAAVREALVGAEADLDWSLDPRTAVLRAYARMEGVLGAHGLARRDSEAPREYLTRSLAEIAGAGPDVERLTGRFEEARYSTHRIDEAARDDARQALQSLGRRLAISSEAAVQR